MGFWDNLSMGLMQRPGTSPQVKTDYLDVAVRSALHPLRFLQSYLAGPLGSLFRLTSGQVPTLVDYVREIFAADGTLQHFYRLLFQDFNPDINGYTLAFLVPPPFSGLNVLTRDTVVNLVPFAAVDYSPPGVQLNTATLNPRTGAVPYATELSENNQFGISFIDDMNLDIFGFHCAWLYYIFELLNGIIAPSPEYIDGSLSGHLDYVGALYVVKYMPDMQTITYVGKCTGVFPQGLPVRELVGSRHVNELTTLPFTYMSAAYRDYVVGDPASPNAYLLAELQQLVLGRFMFSGFLP